MPCGREVSTSCTACRIWQYITFFAFPLLSMEQGI
jgi:hypothetical protein